MAKKIKSSKYSFERTELRVMQNTYTDNEDFLNVLADLIGSLSEKLDAADTRASLAEHEVRLWENGDKG